MYTLNTINFKIIYSANGNMTTTKTIVNAIAALGKVRSTMTAEDVTYMINRKVYSDEQVTEKQVSAVLNDIARSSQRGERYHGLKFLNSIGCGFYEYK